MGKQQEDAYKEAIENYRATSQARVMKSSETCAPNVANLLPRRQISNYFMEFRKVLKLYFSLRKFFLCVDRSIYFLNCVYVSNTFR